MSGTPVRGVWTCMLAIPYPRGASRARPWSRGNGGSIASSRRRARAQHSWTPASRARSVPIGDAGRLWPTDGFAESPGTKDGPGGEMGRADTSAREAESKNVRCYERGSLAVYERLHEPAWPDSGRQRDDGMEWI